MRYFFQLIFLFALNLYATNNMVTVEVSLNREDYKDKDLNYIKQILLKEAKLEAAEKLFGVFVDSQITMHNSKLVKDLSILEQGGIVHIKGALDYHNGKKFGDLALKLQAFATNEDIRSMQPHKIVLNNFTFSNKNLTLKQLKEEAKKAFLIEAIAQKKPTIKMSKTPYKDAKRVAFSVNITKLNFHSQWMAYSVSGVVEYIPLFLRKTTFEKQEKNFIVHKNKKLILQKDFVSLSLFNTKGFVKYANIQYKNGFIFDHKIIKKMKQIDRKNSLVMNLKGKLFVPSTIQSNFVTLKVLNAPYFMDVGGDAYYELWINNKKLENQEIETYVIKDKKYRYINFACYASTDSADDFETFQEVVLESLKNLTFEVSDEDEVKNITLGLLHFKEKSFFNVEFIQPLKQKFILENSLGGILFSKKFLKQLQMNDKKGAQSFKLQTKIFIPKELQNKKSFYTFVNLAPSSFNSDDNAQYSIMLNNTIVKNFKTKLPVEKGKNYIDVTIDVKTDSAHDYKVLSRYILSYLNALTFIFSDEEEENFYSVEYL